MRPAWPPVIIWIAPETHAEASLYRRGGVSTLGNAFGNVAG